MVQQYPEELPVPTLAWQAAWHSSCRGKDGLPTPKTQGQGYDVHSHKMSNKRPPRKKPEQPRVHPDLAGFSVEINSFGEVKTNYDLDKLNLFLNRNVKDKKFRGREDIEGVPEEFREPAGPEDEDTAIAHTLTAEQASEGDEEDIELPPDLDHLPDDLGDEDTAPEA